MTSLPSSVEPMGAGSTYLRVVKSIDTQILAVVQRFHLLPLLSSLTFSCLPLSQGMTIICWREHFRKKERLTFLLVDLGLDVQIEQGDEDIAAQVYGANSHENTGVVKGNALRHLHHAQHDDEVGAKTRRSEVSFDHPDRCVWWCDALYGTHKSTMPGSQTGLLTSGCMDVGIVQIEQRAIDLWTDLKAVWPIGRLFSCLGGDSATRGASSERSGEMRGLTFGG